MDPTDSKYIGPGTWSVMHRLAYSAASIDSQRRICSVIETIIETFPCLICRNHAKDYLRHSPPERFIGVSVETSGSKEALGIFMWTWKFHNAVNARLGKSSLDWDTAISIYGDSGVCVAGCGDKPVDSSRVSSSRSSKGRPNTFNLTSRE